VEVFECVFARAEPNGVAFWPRAELDSCGNWEARARRLRAAKVFREERCLPVAFFARTPRSEVPSP
jgi:hypothetical protein